METFTLHRNIEVEDSFDIVVAGGGPSGIAAAVSAGRLGKKVLLIEATGCLGGMGTSGLVSAFGPMSNGEIMLTQGFVKEVIERMYAAGWMEYGVTPEAWTTSYMRWTQYNPEYLKIVYEEFTDEAGVEVRFFTRVIDADTEGKTVKGIIINNIDGYKYIKAEAYVDATGDAVLSALCGVDYYEAYRDTEKGQPSTLVSIWGDIDWDAAKESIPDHKRKILEAIERGKFSVPDRQFGINRIGKHTGYLNAGHLFGTNPVSNKSVSSALKFGRKQLLEYEDFLHKELPGFENADLVSTGALLGNRESRRIVGEEQLTKEDFFAKRQFWNQIAVYNRFLDIHPYDSSIEEWERFQTFHNKYQLGVGKMMGIPYGILVPLGWKNIWVAGRCVSVDNQVLGVIRSQPCCAVIGQAAGCAAAISVDGGYTAQEIPVQQLQAVLRNQGAYIPSYKSDSKGGI